MNWITLDEEPVAIATPVPIVYSTNPKIPGASDGLTYFIKGPDTETLVAEAVGYLLASRIGVDVPEWAFCHNSADDNKIYFASRAIRVRSGVDQLLRRPELIVNPGLLPAMLAFDVWVSNRDRNMGGIVAEPVGGRDGAEAQLYAIDFEKSDILRGVDRFTVTAKYHPRDCRPRNELGTLVAGIPFPKQTCDRIEAMPPDGIVAAFEQVAFALAGHSVTWIDSASDFLASRAKSIHRLVTEACQ